jgi:hypothetical protein
MFPQALKRGISQKSPGYTKNQAGGGMNFGAVGSSKSENASSKVVVAEILRWELAEDDGWDDILVSESNVESAEVIRVLGSVGIAGKPNPLVVERISFSIPLIPRRNAPKCFPIERQASGRFFPYSKTAIAPITIISMGPKSKNPSKTGIVVSAIWRRWVMREAFARSFLPHTPTFVIPSGIISETNCLKTDAPLDRLWFGLV